MSDDFNDELFVQQQGRVERRVTLGEIADSALLKEVERLRDENLRLYRELTRMTSVGPEYERLQELLEGVAIPGDLLLTAAADEIERLRKGRKP